MLLKYVLCGYNIFMFFSPVTSNDNTSRQLMNAIAYNLDVERLLVHCMPKLDIIFV